MRPCTAESFPPPPEDAQADAAQLVVAALVRARWRRVGTFSGQGAEDLFGTFARRSDAAALHLRNRAAAAIEGALAEAKPRPAVRVIVSRLLDLVVEGMAFRGLTVTLRAHGSSSVLAVVAELPL